MEYWAKKTSKKTPQSKLKTRLDNFGNDYGPFWKFEVFLTFLKPFEDSILHGTRGTSFVSKKSLQNMFKTRLHTFGNVFGLFWKLEIIWLFWNFSKTRPSMEHWAKKISKEKPQNTFGHLGTISNNFRTLKFFWFFSWIISKSLPRKLNPDNWTQVL